MLPTSQSVDYTPDLSPVPEDKLDLMSQNLLDKIHLVTIRSIPTPKNPYGLIINHINDALGHIHKSEVKLANLLTPVGVKNDPTLQGRLEAVHALLKNADFAVNCGEAALQRHPVSHELVNHSFNLITETKKNLNEIQGLFAESLEFMDEFEFYDSPETLIEPDETTIKSLYVTKHKLTEIKISLINARNQLISIHKK